MTTISPFATAATLWLCLAAPRQVVAQSPHPSPILEAALGWAGFVDERWMDRALIGGGARWFITRRVAVGPELVYLRGSDGDDDWTLTGNLTVDLRVEQDRRQHRVMPYLAFGGGYLQQTRRFGAQTFTSSEGTASAGGGVRIALGRRLFVAPELRIGYEPTWQAVATVGLRPGP